MNDFGDGRSSQPWNFYPSSDFVEASPPRPEDQVGQGHWKNFGETSMNAVSFGFVATAILISMFLIMAILEHLFRPTLSTSQDGVTESLESGYAEKSRNRDMVCLNIALLPIFSFCFIFHLKIIVPLIQTKVSLALSHLSRHVL
ncbi:hypothetical protein RND81_02G177300 [Saponaria officinalis]|uniref:Uncharacterized protein n=1 Tax=Saponaria officinalis TaxID=3572 RepID=A0AAW1MNC7_SAPOF